MSTLRISIHVESHESGPAQADDWSVSIVRYSPAWQPRRWRDEPPADAVVALHSIALAGVSREIADCFVRAFNARELKRPKRCWARRSKEERR